MNKDYPPVYRCVLLAILTWTFCGLLYGWK